MGAASDHRHIYQGRNFSSLYVNNRRGVSSSFSNFFSSRSSPVFYFPSFSSFHRRHRGASRFSRRRGEARKKFFFLFSHGWTPPRTRRTPRINAASDHLNHDGTYSFSTLTSAEASHFRRYRSFHGLIDHLRIVSNLSTPRQFRNWRASSLRRDDPRVSVAVFV